MSDLLPLPVMQTAIDNATPQRLTEWLDAIQEWRLPIFNPTAITIKKEAAEYAALVRDGEPGKIAQARVWLHSLVTGWPGDSCFNIFTE